MIITQIISAGKDEQCDLNPFGSLHADKSKVMPFCKTRSFETLIDKYKICPCGCKILYSMDTPFVKSGQIGGIEMSIRCYERLHHLTSDNYREALRQEYELELKMKEE